MKKMNKTFKRIAVITSASLLAACAMVPMFTSMTASAVNVTVGGAADTNRTFVAYKVLNATVSADNTTITYEVVDGYAAALKTALGLPTTATNDEIITAIENLEGDATGMRTFADKLYAAVKANTPDVSAIKGGEAKDMATGYYLIVDTSTDLADDVRSKVMVNTADNRQGGLTVELKKNGPQFEKKIWDTDDSTTKLPTGDLKDYTGWADSADHDFGDAVPFKLEATLPSDINLYDNYKIVFNDTLDAGLTLNAGSIKVYMNGEDVTDKFTLPTASAASFEISDDNIKDNDVTLSGNDEITVYYTATLNENAVIGNMGNWNGAKLTYTNDYYWDGTAGSDNDSTSETPMDYVVAFTYKTVVDKIDGNGAALAGAGFTLSKWISDGTADGGAWAAVGAEVTGVTTFEFKGLDAGKYKLEETTVPEGFTKADDIEFTISATHTLENVTKVTDGSVLTAFDVTAGVGLTANRVSGEIEKTNGDKHAAVSGEVYGEIVNQSGTLLPGTGGIGTTIFYLGGGVMATIGGVYLISKRRMKKSEE